jgi:glycerol-1-phosphate dehydrogenase [NAD(P)+]
MRLELSGFSDVVQVPMTFEVVRTSQAAVEKLAAARAHMTSGRGNMLVLCGSGGTTRAMAEAYVEMLRDGANGPPIHQVALGSLDEARELDAMCAKLDIDLLVAIGGGRVIDTAKHVAFHRKVALACIPSVLSSDGITSPVAVLQDSDGRKRSLPSGIPACVVVDLSLTTQAPLQLTKAGVGDLLSNASALLDLEDYEASGLGAVSGFAKLLSYSAYQLVMPLTEEAIASADGQEAVARGLIMSGLSMAFSGNSLPCSGGEHLISHAVDHLGYSKAPHGLQVAVATLYCLALRRVLGRESTTADLQPVVTALGLPDRPEDLGLSREQFLQAVELGPEMREGRFTVLHQGTQREALEAAYDRAFA